MEKTDMLIIKEAMPEVMYQEAVEAMGFIRGYINASDHPFSGEFVDAINLISQFVGENHPKINICINPKANIEEMLDALKQK